MFGKQRFVAGECCREKFCKDAVSLGDGMLALASDLANLNIKTARLPHHLAVVSYCGVYRCSNNGPDPKHTARRPRI